jgi:hypothetical protein
VGWRDVVKVSLEVEIPLQSLPETEVPMMKAIIIGCAMCTGAGATAYVLTSSDNPAAQSTANPKVKAPVADGSMQSVIQELHSKAHQPGLPIQVIEDPI